MPCWGHIHIHGHGHTTHTHVYRYNAASEGKEFVEYRITFCAGIAFCAVICV